MTFSERGQVHRGLHDAKGRERPRVAFRAAGRAKRGGRSRPFDVLARSPDLRACPRICLCSQVLQNRGQKTDQKTVRKTDFRTVFHDFDGSTASKGEILAEISGHLRSEIVSDFGLEFGEQVTCMRFSNNWDNIIV